MDRQTGRIAARAREVRGGIAGRDTALCAPLPPRQWVGRNIAVGSLVTPTVRGAGAVFGLAAAFSLVTAYFASDPGDRRWWALGVVLGGIAPAVVYLSVNVHRPKALTPVGHAVKTGSRALAWIGAAFVFAAAQYNVEHFLDEAPFTSRAALEVYRNFFEWSLPVVAVAVWAELSRVLTPAKTDSQPLAARRLENLWPFWQRRSDTAAVPVSRVATEVVRYLLSPGGTALVTAGAWVAVDATVRMLINIPS